MKGKIFMTASLGVLALGVGAASHIGSLGGDRSRLEVTTPRGRLQIAAVNNNIFEVRMIPQGESAESYQVDIIGPVAGNDSAAIFNSVWIDNPAIVQEADNLGADLNVTANIDYVYLTSPTTQVVVDRKTGKVGFYDNKGRELLREANGLDNSDEVKSVTFLAAEGESFFGAGERGHAYNLAGDTLVMFNRQNYGYTGDDPRTSQMNITMPYIVSDKGYGVLFDDFNAARLVLGSDTIEYTTQNPAMPLSYYFINGRGSLAGTTEQFTELTGRQDLPPFWALGYITSKYGYKTQDETLGVIDTLKRAGYPVDGIVLDLYWYGKEEDMGSFKWNEDQFPDHRKMLADLKERGVKTVIISQPYIHKVGAIDNYNYLSDKGMLTHDANGEQNDVSIWIGDAGMLDVSNPATRRWLWNRYRDLTLDGVEGWWGDLGEPEVHPLSIVHNNGLTAAQYHNLYGNEWSRIIYEGFKNDFPDKRLMTLMRGGTTGLQRYSVYPWSTDVSRSWGGLKPQINIMLNSGLSGLGYMSSDIGGFAVDPANPTDDELYVRWLQLGTFNPILRTHAQLKPEPYNYPKHEDILKRFIKMRYEWLPYNYTLAYENATLGYPLVRPLNFEKSGTTAAAGLQDEYLWGNEVLVAPVITKGARSRSVTFPEGATWIDWDNPQLKYKGGTTAQVQAPLSKLPLFVKQGAFIPQYTEPIENTDQYNPQLLTVRYFPSSKQTSYTLFDDDRKSTTSLADGAYMLTTFTGQRAGGVTTIGIDNNRQGYNGMPPYRTLTLVVEDVRKAPQSVTFESLGQSEELERSTAGDAAGWSYDARSASLLIRFSWEYEPCSITIR